MIDVAQRFRLKSEKLSAALSEKRLSQNAMARRLGISKSYLSQLANGSRRYPGAQVRERLVEALQIPFEELFDLERFETGTRTAGAGIRRRKGREAEKQGTTLFRLGGRAVQLRIESVPSRSGNHLGETMLQGLLQDVRYGIRVLIGRPGFSFACLLLLATGIGANTILYSLVYGVLLKPLPFREPSRLVMLWERPLDEPDGRAWVSPANFLDWREQARSFQSMAAFEENSAVLTGFEKPQNVQVASVSPGFLSQLGIEPIQGRFFSKEEAEPGSDRVVVIGAALWRSRFGSDSIAGKKLTLDGNDYRVVGVARSESGFPAGVDAWTPLVFDFDIASSRGAHYLKALARLERGVDPKKAQEELDLIAARLREAYPEANANAGIAMIPLRQDMVAGVRPTLLVLWGSVTVLLLIACANAANLFLARSLQRNREIAIRLAMGAGKSRIARQLLTESLLLSLAAGALGVALTYAALPKLLSLVPFDLPRAAAIQVDQSVLLYTLAVSMGCGIAFGLIPALQAWRPDLRESLTLAAGGTFSRGQSRFRSALVIVEVALAVALVIAAGLFQRGFQRLQAVEPGFDPSNVLAMRISLPDARYDEAGKRQFHRVLGDEVRRLPGVVSSGEVAWLPLGGAWVFSFEIEGRPPQRPEDRSSGVFLPVESDYFKTMGIPLLTGRDFDSTDRADSTLTVIVNETLAKRFFAGEDPIGKRVTIGYGRGEPAPREIVGVVGDVKQWGLAAPTPPCFYLPHQQVPFASMYLVVRSKQPEVTLTEALKAQVWRLDAELAPGDVQTLPQRVRGSTAGSNFRSFLASSFGVGAGLLALFGIYGVISFATSQRAREIGIRMALGARSRQVLATVIMRGLWLSLAGSALGIFLAWTVSGVLSRFLFGIEATDFSTYAGAAGLMVALSLFASYLPAKRASRTDPATVLRHE